MSGRVYLLHFASPIGNPQNPRGQAQHYLGHASKSLKQRIERHQAGNGAAIMAAVKAAGISWVVAKTWKGNRATERQLKNRHNAKKLCPICRGDHEHPTHA